MAWGLDVLAKEPVRAQGDEGRLEEDIMLVLTRKIGEVVVIGDQIEVTVLRVNGAQVRIGIRAPKEVPVHRLEISRRVQDEKEEMLVAGDNN